LQAAILAGGLGTRLGRLTRRIPKPMVVVAGKPFLEREVGLLRRNGVDDLVLCVGHLGGMVEDYFGDGRNWGVRIRYSHDGPGLMGPAGALKAAAPLLDKRFFVTYGDAYLRMDYRRLMGAFVDSRKLGMMAVYRNRNRYGRSDVVVEGGRVTRYKKSGGRSMEWVNFGVTALDRASLEFIPSGKECGEEDFYGELIRRGELCAFPVKDRFYEIGTPKSLKEFERFLTKS
jgi:N-acetyl-alpha-D-muramate 1-phosphate uridylyltransferase